MRCNSCPAVFGSELGLFQDKGYLVDLILIVSLFCKVAERIIVSPDDFFPGSVAAHVLIAHAEAYHVHAHVGRRLIWTFSIYAFKQGVEYREYFDVPVIAGGDLSVCFEVERVDHVHIVEVSCGCLICNVDRVLQRKIPYREGLELGISGLRSALVLMIKLAQADSHLSASGTRGGHNNQRLFSLYVVISAESLIRVYECCVIGISLYGVMVVDLDAEALESGTVGICTGLAVVVGDDHAAHAQTDLLELFAETQHVFIISDSEVASYLVLLYVNGTDDYYYFSFILQLHEHAELAVRVESRQYAAGMVVIE